MKTCVTLCVLSLLAACAPPSSVDAPTLSAVASFDGVVDRGAVSIVRFEQFGMVRQAVVTQLPTTASGTTGTTTPPADTVLLHQAADRSLDGACNLPPYADVGVPVPFVGVCVPIQMINGYAGFRIQHAYVQLTALTYLGPTAGGTVVTYVKSPSDPTLGVDNTYGLWSYGQLGAAGTSHDRATRNWYFQTTDPGADASFRFTAVVMGELDPR